MSFSVSSLVEFLELCAQLASVLHNLRVNPVGQPDTVALVAFDQLALYDNQ
jgi:hypothetical protein